MLRNMIPHFKPYKKGLNQVLGELEQELLNYLWEHDESTGKSIFEGVAPIRNNAYHTILTVLNRMVKKGLLRKRKKGNLYYFAPVFTREEFTQLACKEAIRGALEISQANAIAAIVDLLADTDASTIDQLEQEIAAKRRELGGSDEQT
ncbi:BlaI/MecI/CopY family transcriptional regulator [Candidatus Poribacteria bacterium]|nr:BlaI/MecI/CopY family transcriptional regulator [Candidatus Poribacteria bacterium]